jgi:hypothetical protein
MEAKREWTGKRQGMLNRGEGAVGGGRVGERQSTWVATACHVSEARGPEPE